MEFKIVKGLPPNIDEIRRSGLKPDETTVYAFRDRIYNPSDLEIPADVLYHEQVHIKQQQTFPLAEYWWTKYLNSREFRASQEIEAYAHQYLFVNKTLGAKAASDCMEEMSAMLSSKIYNLGINKYQAQTAIRYKAKELNAT